MYTLKTAIKEVSIIAAIIIGLSACVSTAQVKDGAEISANAYIANESVRIANATLGGFAVNQEAITELNQWQSEFDQAIKDGAVIAKVDYFYNWGLSIYVPLRAEAIDRQDELSPLQLDMLLLLDKQLMSLSDKIVAFKTDESNVDAVQAVRSVSEILSFTKTVLQLYGVVAI